MSRDAFTDEAHYLRDEIKRLRKSLSELTTSLEVLLKVRGFRIYRKEPSEDLLLPKKEFFKIENVTRYATQEVTKDYIEYMIKTGLVEKLPDGFRLTIGPIKSFGETLEWFLSKIFKVEFAAEAIWGIRFKRPRVGGDYDLIAKVDGKILYMEIKY